MVTLPSWWSVLVVCVYAFTIPVTAAKINREHVSALRTAVSHVLGVPDFTQWSSDSDSSFPVRWQHPPRFMTRLYHLYRSRRLDTTHPDTVRSIRPKIRDVTRETLLVFNMSSITSQEHVYRAEVHMYIRKRRRTELANMHARIVMTTPSEVLHEARVELHEDEKHKGWAVLDVSGMIQDGGDLSSWSGALLVLSLRPNRSRDTDRAFRLGRYIGRKSQPFFVVFSQEIFNVTQTNSSSLSGRTNSQGQDMAFTDNESGVESVRGLSRGKRSIYNNEIPQNPTEYEYAHVNVFKTHPDILMSRKESKRRLGHSNLIPYPDIFRRKYHRQRKGKRWRNRNKKNFQLKPKFSFSKNSWHDLDRNLATPPLDTNMCTRRRLVVNFVDIGWGEWIISPKSFDAHYCSGTCPFPLSKRLRPSNHATIQSLIHAIGVYPDVPAPCCVPDVMSSVTLLYFDEDKNVVLKNYPHMSVESCACR